MLKILVTALAMAVGLAGGAPALALQTTVTQVEKNADGSMTYHFVVKLDPDGTLMPGATKGTGGLVTIYNFFGLLDGSAKSPVSWEFLSEEFGRTPTRNSYSAVLPVDVPNTPNLTWTVTKPVAAGSQIESFIANTRMTGAVEGEYTALVTHQFPEDGSHDEASFPRCRVQAAGC